MSHLARQSMENDRKARIVKPVEPESSSPSHALAQITPQIVQRAMSQPESLQSNDLLTLQRSIGNREVQRMLASYNASLPAATPAQSLTSIQPKLKVGAANDRYEQEADRIANTVMHRFQPSAQPTNATESDEQPQASPDVQRLTHLNEAQLSRQSVENSPIGQAGGEVGGDLEAQIQRSRGQGRPLQEPARQKMEAAFGADFSDVQVHTNPHADQLNRSINAEAFTTGKDIFFRQGAYAPDQAAGQKLLAHELTHVVQQTGPQNVQRQSASPTVQVQGRLPSDRISTKRRMMHLDFVLMKRQDAQFKRAIGKALGIKKKPDPDNHGTYGHYWTELGSMEDGVFTPKSSYGWWPKDGVSGTETFRGVEGELNRDGGDHDPHEGDNAKISFHPVMNVDPDAESYQSIRDRVTNDIETFAHSFSGSWNWRFGWGKNCQTFQDRLKSKVGLHFKSAKEWLRDPEAEKRTQDRQKAEQVQEENRTRAVQSVVGEYTVPERMTTEAFVEVTKSDSPKREFREVGALRSGGKNVGATGRTAERTTGAGRQETMVEYVFENEVYWMSEPYWQMYFDKPYPANQ